MLMCKEITKLVSSGEVEDLGWRGRLEYRIHLMMCRNCRIYVKQIHAISRTAGRIWGKLGGDPARLDTLQKKILDQLD